MHKVEEGVLYTLELFVSSQLEQKEQIGALLKEVRAILWFLEVFLNDYGCLKRPVIAQRGRIQRGSTATRKG